MDDMTSALQDGMWVGSQTETMVLFIAGIVLLAGFSVWYEFYADT